MYIPYNNTLNKIDVPVGTSILPSDLLPHSTTDLTSRIVAFLVACSTSSFLLGDPYHDDSIFGQFRLRFSLNV